jgi:hypothetical protein
VSNGSHLAPADLAGGIGIRSADPVSRYHAYREGRYSLPNDEIEQQREELMHILVMDILEHKLYLAPMAQPPKKVMDLATGVGLWAIESNQPLNS